VVKPAAVYRKEHAERSRSGLWIETAALFICGAAPLIYGITLLGSELCDGDGNCIQGTPVENLAASLIVLGGILLVTGFLSAMASLRTRSAAFLYEARKYFLGFVAIAALVTAFFWFLSTPSFYT